MLDTCEHTYAMELCLLQESNLMNSVITDMYRKKASCIGSGSAEETACPVVSTSSGLSYCIDRTGVMPESDQHRPSGSSSGSLTVDDVKAVATTPAESAADDLIVIKDGRDHDKNLHTSVNMPEHLTTVDVSEHCSARDKLAVTYLHLLSSNIRANK